MILLILVGEKVETSVGGDSAGIMTSKKEIEVVSIAWLLIVVIVDVITTVVVVTLVVDVVVIENVVVVNMVKMSLFFRSDDKVLISRGDASVVIRSC